MIKTMTYHQKTLIIKTPCLKSVQQPMTDRQLIQLQVEMTLWITLQLIMLVKIKTSYRKS